MKISYRSNSYEDRSPMLEATEGEILGTPKHQHFQFPYPKHIPVPQITVSLQYRDAIYGTHKLNLPTDKVADREGENSNYRSRWLTDKNHLQTMIDNEADKIHKANIQRSLQHRLQVAKSRGDRHLVQLLEAECKEMALCSSL